MRLTREQIENCRRITADPFERELCDLALLGLEAQAKIERMRPGYEALEAAIHYQNKMRVPDATGILARELLRINEEAKK